MNKSKLVIVVLGLVIGVGQPRAWGQGYGTDTQNVLTPAAGGMAGVSLAEPQDVPAAIFGNPATLTQFHGHPIHPRRRLGRGLSDRHQRRLGSTAASRLASPRGRKGSPSPKSA